MTSSDSIQKHYDERQATPGNLAIEHVCYQALRSAFVTPRSTSIKQMTSQNGGSEGKRENEMGIKLCRMFEECIKYFG